MAKNFKTKETETARALKKALQSAELGENEAANPDFTGADIRRAFNTGMVMVYSKHPIENGWDHRNLFVISKDGIISPVVLNIARTNDGRNILYRAYVDKKNGIAEGHTPQSRGETQLSIPFENNISHSDSKSNSQISEAATSYIPYTKPGLNEEVTTYTNSIP